MTENLNILVLVAQASPVVQAVMAALVLASLVSWAVIFAKAIAMATLRRSNQAFEPAVWSGKSPYVGLFGTVWGIMHAFVGLSNLQQVTLATVAPGIAEALVATAIGLFAAIPAVIAYNHLARSADRVAVQLEGFIEEFSNILQRNGTVAMPPSAPHHSGSGAMAGPGPKRRSIDSR